MLACNQRMIEFHLLWKKIWDMQESPNMKLDWHLVNGFFLWKWEKRELNESLSKTFANISKRLIGLLFVHLIFWLILWTEIMLAIFHVSEKTLWFSEDLKHWTKGSGIESPKNWIMWTEMLSTLIFRRDSFFKSVTLVLSTIIWKLKIKNIYSI